MADLKITQLDAITTPDVGDVMEIVSAPETTPVNKKITWANIGINTLPTDLKISTASKGGVLKCIDGATGDTAVTADGFIEDPKYAWYFTEVATSASAEFDSAERRTGKFTLKIEAIDATGTAIVYNTQGVTLPILAMEAIPLKVSTAYRLNIYVKTNIGVGASGVYADVVQYDSAAAVGTTVTTNKVSASSAGWVLITIPFTSDNDAVYARIALHNDVAGAINAAWFDVNSMTLEEVVTDTTFTGKVPEKIRPVLQAVTSTDNIDQSLDTGGAYANTYALTNAVNEGATHKQTFTPTKKYISQIGVWIVAKGTGVNWSLVVHDASNVALAECQIIAASLVEGAFNYFDVPNFWVSGALHFHVYASATTGTPTLKANTTDDLETGSFIQRYAKRTENFTVICNGIKTQLTADKDGLLSGAIVDLDNAKYRYYADINNVTAENIGKINDIYSASVGGQTYGGASTLRGWWFTADDLRAKNDAARNADWKVNTILPIKHLKATLRIYQIEATDKFLQISTDYVNWTTLITFNNATNAYYTETVETDLINGLSTFYLRCQKGATADSLEIDQLTIEADIDTSKIPTGLFYPLATNQFTETVKLPSTATRVYFQSAKYTNEYGVIVPALEFTDASAVVIGYVPLKLDNSQETNPCVSILSTTTNYQQSGTGSAVTGGYVLNTGEYMTLTGAIAEIKVDYQVGGGTTAIAAITKNALFLSSNGESIDSTQDPSHQTNTIVGIRQQGLVDRIGNLGDEMAEVKKGIANTQQYVRNNALIVGFDSGTTDAYAITLSDFTGYVTGMSVLFKANTVNTGACTLNINDMGAKAIVKGITTALSNADILALMWCQCVYDGVAFVLLNPRAL